MTTSTAWQLGVEAAERYERILTPAILGPFARALVDFAGASAGERVLDVGCGTGAAARYAAELVGSSGWVVGVDVNGGMLEVAGSLAAGSGATVEWRLADARKLPLEDGSVDMVLCAQSLQFMPEKERVLSEMRRAAGTSGRVALSLWCPIEESPYFHSLVEAMARHVGAETAAGLGTAFALSDGEEIERLVEKAGFGEVEMAAVQLDLPLPPLAEFVPRHISATPMAAGFRSASEAARRAVVGEVVEKMRVFGVNGRVGGPFRSYMVMCRSM